MSTTLVLVILILLALLLFAIEGLVTPGFGVSGVGATICVVAADIIIGINYGPAAAICAVVVSTALVLGFFWWFAHSRTLEKMSLNSTISSTAATTEQLSVAVGDEGRATTRLALIGNADFDGRQVEVKSADGFIDEGTPVVVVHVNEALVLVKAKK